MVCSDDGGARMADATNVGISAPVKVNLPRCHQSLLRLRGEGDAFCNRPSVCCLKLHSVFPPADDSRYMRLPRHCTMPCRTCLARPHYEIPCHAKPKYRPNGPALQYQTAKLAEYEIGEARSYTISTNGKHSLYHHHHCYHHRKHHPLANISH